MNQKSLKVIFLIFLVFSMTSAKYDKIKNVVILELENRSFDHMLGWMTQGGQYGDTRVDGLTKDDCNPIDFSDLTKGTYCVNDEAVDNCPYDPNHGYVQTTQRIFACNYNSTYNQGTEGSPCVEHESSNGNATMQGFVTSAKQLGKSGKNELTMWKSENVPIITSLAKEFANFDRYFCGYPGSTWPNRMFILSGTNYNCTDTYCNVGEAGLPQKTIFQQLEESDKNLTWKMYYADDIDEVQYLAFLKLETSKSHFFDMDQFYDDAANGGIPNLSHINPRWAANYDPSQKDFGLMNTQHPVASVLEGERLIKNVYEAIRNGPQWNETLLIVTYDEHGGFYDHVSPPQENIPSPEGIYNSYGFNSNRLGLRVPFIPISPYISKGQLVNSPPESQKPFNNSEFEHSSIAATIKKIFDLPGDLTNRTMWAATFENVIDLDEPRTDCPTKLDDLPDPDFINVLKQQYMSQTCKRKNSKGCTFFTAEQELNQTKKSQNTTMKK